MALRGIAAFLDAGFTSYRDEKTRLEKKRQTERAEKIDDTERQRRNKREDVLDQRAAEIHDWWRDQQAEAERDLQRQREIDEAFEESVALTNEAAAAEPLDVAAPVRAGRGAPPVPESGGNYSDPMPAAPSTRPRPRGAVPPSDEAPTVARTSAPDLPVDPVPPSHTNAPQAPDPALSRAPAGAPPPVAEPYLPVGTTPPPAPAPVPPEGRPSDAERIAAMQADTPRPGERPTLKGLLFQVNDPLARRETPEGREPQPPRNPSAEERIALMQGYPMRPGERQAAAQAPVAASEAPAPPRFSGAANAAPAPRGAAPMDAGPTPAALPTAGAAPVVVDTAPTAPAPLPAEPSARAGLGASAPSELAAEAVKVLAETATPASAELAERAAETPPNATPAQRDKVAKDWLDHYREVGAKRVMQELLAKGEFDRAKEFQTWLDEGETKAAMESWARAGVAAWVGDFDTFAEEVRSAYNRLDYFGDGYTITEDSDFVRDQAGNVLGAKVVFRDEATGDTHEQVFDDPEDMITLGLTQLDPQIAFEHLKGRVDAARTLEATAAADAKTKAEAEAERNRPPTLHEAIKELAERDADLDPMDMPDGWVPFSQRPIEEQLAAAREYIAALAAAPGEATEGTAAQAGPR